MNHSIKLSIYPFLIILITGIISCCPIEETRVKLADFKSVCNEDINEIGIVVPKDEKISCYIKIKNKEIIKEFNDIIQKDTYIPLRRVGQFNKNAIITIKTKKRIFTFDLLYNPYEPSTEFDAVEITFYKLSSLDVYSAFNLVQENSIKTLSDIYWHNGGLDNVCFEFRNNRLYNFIQEYFIKIMNNKDRLKGNESYIECKNIRI